MTAISAILGSAITAALLGAWFQSWFAHHRLIEGKRQGIGVMLQAELIRLHRDLKDHSRSMQRYLAKAANVGATKESDYPQFSPGDFPVFKGVIPDIGLFKGDVSYMVAYCYFSAERFLRYQQQFLSDLAGLLNSSLLATRVQDLSAHENALMVQIERIVPLLAHESRDIPFNPSSG
jgi:hypothetical protein